MNNSLRFDLLGFIYCCAIFFISINALPSDPSPASSSNPPISILDGPKILPDQVLRSLQNTTSIQPLRSSRCYEPAPTARYVSPRDATVALGELAQMRDFFAIKTFHKSIAMAIEGTAVILLVKIGDEDDQFTIFDVVVQALNIINYCIFQQWPAERLGGDMEVGTGDKFRVVVQGKTT
ncbi:MAG: hypothetical protein Q9226_007829 [Calogaya cf. arnoldii]